MLRVEQRIFLSCCPKTIEMWEFEYTYNYKNFIFTKGWTLDIFSLKRIEVNTKTYFLAEFKKVIFEKYLILPNIR